MSSRSVLAVFCLSQCFAQQLQIQVLRGDSTNNLAGRSAEAPAVRIMRGAEPASDAVVIFTAPSSGPSVTFSGDGPVAQVQTYASGIAVAPPMRAVGGDGPLSISVVAKHHGDIAIATVQEMNLGFTGFHKDGELEIQLVQPVEITPRNKPRKFRLRVARGDGQPLAGVEVVAEMRSARSPHAKQPAIQSYVTGTDGIVEITVDSKPDDIDLKVRARDRGLTVTRFFELVR